MCNYTLFPLLGFINVIPLFIFFGLLLTTEVMGICPSADGGSIRCPSADGQGECGSKTAGMHVSQPVPIGILWLFQIIYIKN